MIARFEATYTPASSRVAEAMAIGPLIAVALGACGEYQRVWPPAEIRLRRSIWSA